MLPRHGSSFLEDLGWGCRPLLLEGSSEDDVAFCNRLTVNAGVTVLPVSHFILADDKCSLFAGLSRVMLCVCGKPVNCLCKHESCLAAGECVLCEP